MKKINKISVSQMFSMLFISRLVVETTYSSIMVKGDYIWDHILSAIVSFFLIFILVIPIYFLFKSDKSMDVLDNSYILLGKAGHIVSGIYAFYFLFICVHTLSLFKVFLANVINPPVSTEVLLSSMVIAACYGAYKGVEGLARASGIILFFMVLSIIFIGFSLLFSIDTLNFTPFFYKGTESFVGGLIFMIARSSCIPAMAILFPMAKGKLKQGLFFWNLSIYTLICVSIVLMLGSLGDFLQTQLFPVYTAASIAKIGSLENLDVLYLGIWTMGIFIKLSLFLMLSGECTKKFLGEKIGKISVLLFGAVMVFFGIFLNKNAVLSGIFGSLSLFTFLIFTAVFIPLILILIKKIKFKKIRKRENFNEN